MHTNFLLPGVYLHVAFKRGGVLSVSVKSMWVTKIIIVLSLVLHLAWGGAYDSMVEVPGVMKVC